jgi:hypothetical protein
MICTKFDWNWLAGSGKGVFFPNINISKYGFPYCGPSWSPGTMMWTILNLHYIRKLSWKYDLFWLSGSGEKNFQMTPTHFCIFVIISPLKRTWPFSWTIYNSLYQKMICIKFDWNWPPGSGEDFFQYKTYVNKVFRTVTPPDQPGPWCEQFWIYIISQRFHVNMTYSGSVVLEKKIFKWPHPIFAIIYPLKRTWPFLWTI